MFSVTNESRQYETYILSDQAAQSVIEVVPERGGIVTRWQVQNHTIFYMDEERFTHPELTVRGGIPILFPICGNLPNDTYTYGSASYTLKQHGFARNLPWQVIRQHNDSAASLTVSLASTAETLASYPFEFLVEFTYELQGTTLTINQRYTNCSSSPMPFSAGLHPYFWVGDKTGLQVNLPATQFYDQASKTQGEFTGTFDFDQPEIDAAFRPLTGSSATVTDLARQLTLTLTWAEHFTTLVFWTVKGKDFYCLEPWTAPRNAMVTGDDLLHLPAGESLDTSVRLTVTLGVQ
ncbi:MAG: aldose epimerase [Cyanobacteria bacterium]|nr:aldose epimerase [Cyanobacteriota bacterium]MDW8199762.1 aldose epimerase [Cyanobacteriota bacterium SKYGB_h_bin112]